MKKGEKEREENECRVAEKREVDVGGFVEVLEILAEFIYCFPFYFFSFFQYFFKGASKKHEKLVIDSKGWRAETEYKLM